MAAERAKEEGNVQFKLQRYGMAIDLYTKAYGTLVLRFIYPKHCLIQSAYDVYSSPHLLHILCLVSCAHSMRLQS